MSCLMRKHVFCICKIKGADQLCGYRISNFVFATQIVQSLYFLNLKFHVSNNFLWPYSPVCHYENTPMQYTAIFHGCKNVYFQMKFSNFFLIFAQNIDCGYTLEPPQ